MNDRVDHIFRGRIKHFSIKSRGVAVDWFDKVHNLHFLSHAHSDHFSFKHDGVIIGLLEPDFIQQLKSTPHARIYCTEITREIITRLPKAITQPDVLNELNKHFIILKPDETREIQFCDGKKMTVRTIPANHIPGAVMFLFDDGEKRVLYTGDFRYDVREENGEMAALRNFAETYKKVIDYLYVDVQCLDIGRLYHPDRNKLPTRQESKDMVCELITKSKPKSFHIDAVPLGSESIAKGIAEFLNNSADSILDRLEDNCPRKKLYEYTLKDIKIPTEGTTSITYLHVFNGNIFHTACEDTRKRRYKAKDCQKCDSDTLRIRATLQWLFEYNPKYSYSDKSSWSNHVIAPILKREDRDLWQVLYSHHSSDSELRDFLYHLKFKEVFPINEPFPRNFEGIYIKGENDPETSSEKKHRHIRKSLYFSIESSSMKCSHDEKALNVLWLTGNNRDHQMSRSDDKFHVTPRNFENCESILSEVKNYKESIDFILIPCTVELLQSLGKLYCNLFRFIDTLKNKMVTQSKNFNNVAARRKDGFNSVLFYSTTNNMNDQWKQIIDSSRLYRDKKVTKVFYIDLTKIPGYTEANNDLTTRIIFETMKNLIRNEDKEVFVSDWPMPYKFSERKRKYDEELRREPESNEVEMLSQSPP